MAPKKSTKKTARTASKTSKTPKIKDLSPRKNPRGGDRPHGYNDGGGNADD